MNIIGKNVKIRNFETSDLGQFSELVQDKNNHKLSGLEYSIDSAFIKELLDMYIRRDSAYAISLIEDNKMIGIIELNKRGESEELMLTREIGFVVDRKYRKNGYAQEAVSLISDYGFDKLHLTEIWASTEEANLAPQRLLEKLKFEYVYEANQSLPFAEQSNIVKYYLLTK